MITKENWEKLRKKQAELDQLIVEKSPTDLNWVSCGNAERLKLALLVEVGEFANEIKSFKAWRKKPEVDWTKAKEELIDCLGYFLGLCNIYQIDLPDFFDEDVECERYHFSFNELLLIFFARTNDLYIEGNQQFYNSEDQKINEEAKNTYYEWLRIFDCLFEVDGRFQMDDKELLNIYLTKNKINQRRAQAK